MTEKDLANVDPKWTVKTFLAPSDFIIISFNDEVYLMPRKEAIDFQDAVTKAIRGESTP